MGQVLVRNLATTEVVRNLKMRAKQHPEQSGARGSRQ
jgi:plasmid stability protein